MIMYADDTNMFLLTTTKDKLEDIANIYLLRLSICLKRNRLLLKFEKTKFIIFSPKISTIRSH